MPFEILYLYKLKTIVKTFIPDSILLVQKNNHRFTDLSNSVSVERFYSQNDRLVYLCKKQNDYNFSPTGPVK